MFFLFSTRKKIGWYLLGKQNLMKVKLIFLSFLFSSCPYAMICESTKVNQINPDSKLIEHSDNEWEMVFILAENVSILH